jgi:Ni,Fe-hydrogenase III large subunit
MSGFDWLHDYLTLLEREHVVLREDSDPQTLPPAHRLVLDVEDWGTAGKVSAAMGHRHAGVWGDPMGDNIHLRACLAFEGDYLVLETDVPLAQPVLPSHTPYYPGVDRLERHLQDMLGIAFLDHPDARRWTRHHAWAEGEYPLRNDFPVAGHAAKRTPADVDYRFTPILGSGVYEIPVGPVHAGIIEPGHFRFHAVGEEILRLEQRLGYAHKGIEKIAVGRDALGLARLAGRVSGDATVAHAWAACQAMERAAQCMIPPRALHLRALMCERERVANHLGDIGTICNDVGFAFILAQCSRLREQWTRRSHTLFGYRFMMDRVIPGGVACDLALDTTATLPADHAALRRELAPLADIIDDHPSLDDRLLNTGRLAPEDAQALGCTGYVGKASGQGFDVRRDSPYAPYDTVQVAVPDEREGDVAARVRVRLAEIEASLALMDHLLDTLPDGNIVIPFTAPADTTGLGCIDGWRGEMLAFVRFDSAGRIARYFPRDPSWFTWPALERLIHGNIVPEFPVCNKSVNGSYSGHDL